VYDIELLGCRTAETKRVAKKNLDYGAVSKLIGKSK
jgi:hypothetical protein